MDRQFNMLSLIPFLFNGFCSIPKIVTIFQVNSLKQLDVWGGGKIFAIMQALQMSIQTYFIPYMPQE